MPLSLKECDSGVFLTYGPRTRVSTHNLAHDTVCLRFCKELYQTFSGSRSLPFGFPSSCIVQLRKVTVFLPAAARLCPCFDHGIFRPNNCVLCPRRQPQMKSPRKSPLTILYPNRLFFSHVRSSCWLHPLVAVNGTSPMRQESSIRTSLT